MAERGDKPPGYESTVDLSSGAAPIEDLYGRQLGAGAQVGPWVVESFRSMGGFASIYRVHHHKTGDLAALKVLHAELTRWPTILRRFDREAKTIKRLHHPNVCEVIEFGQLNDRRPYYVMEWLEGQDLEECLQERGPFSPEEALAVMEDICDAVSAAHALGVIHRDIKPANIVLVPAEPRARAVLVDFGLAKLLEPDPEDVRLTTTGALLGTPSCMAPEQITGGAIDQRTDVYGLGVTLFHLLTGTKPYDATTVVEIEEMHLQSPTPKASHYVAASAAIDLVIERSLAKDVTARFESAAVLLDELRRAVAAEESAVGSELEGQALGIYVEVRVVDDTDVDSYDDADDLLWLLRERFEALGLAVALETGSSFLAVTASGGALPVIQRKRWVEAAMRAVTELLPKGQDARITAVIAVHIETITTASAGGDRIDGGALLRLGEWTGSLPAGFVVASPSVIEGLEDHFDTTDVPGGFKRPSRR